MKIVIDCAHGAKPKDTGAVGYVTEEKEVRSIAYHLNIKLLSLGYEVRVIQLDSAESVIESLQKRCGIANNWNADLFLSLHMNANSKTDNPMGTEVFTTLKSKAIPVAKRIVDNIAGLGFKNRGLKTADYYVLNNTNCPAALIEFYFVDSLADTNLAKKLGHEKFATVISNAIADTYPIQKKITLNIPPLEVLPKTTQTTTETLKSDDKQSIKIPGITNPVQLDQPIASDTPHFSWYEATKSGARIPANESVTANIIEIARMAQAIRDKFGVVVITSWYRPPNINRAVGGRSKSQHLNGGAIDFYCINASLTDVYKWCDERWPISGLAMKTGQFIHLDCRGIRERWDY